MMNASNATSIDIGYNPEYKTLPLRILEIDKYQRKLTYADCKRRLAKFDPKLVGVLLVSYRDGKYYIIDGQHRKVMLIMAGYEDALCQIVRGLTYEEEAALFKKFNTERKQLGRCDLLVADVEAGAPVARKIVEIVSRCGYSLPRMGDVYTIKGKPQIDAVAALEHAHTMLDDDGLEQELTLINNAWPNNRVATKQGMISGMACFLKAYRSEGLDEKRFVAQLSKMQPETILKQADVDAKYAFGSSDKPKAVARVIWKTYNGNLPGKRKLPYLF